MKIGEKITNLYYRENNEEKKVNSHYFNKKTYYDGFFEQSPELLTLNGRISKTLLIKIILRRRCV